MPAPEPVEADLCIVGAGAAGVAIAHALRHSGLAIVVVEAGTEEPDDLADPLTPMVNVGAPFPVSAQRRRLGGCTNDWSGNCSLLDPVDFEAKSDSPGWPIGSQELEDHTPEVEAFLGLGDGLGAGALATTSAASPFGLGRGRRARLTEKRYIRSFVSAWPQHKESLRRSGYVRVLAGTRVERFEPSEGSRIGAAVAVGDAGPVRIEARAFVVAAGLGNTALLMRGLPPSLVGELPALGRYLHTHLLSLRGFLLPEAVEPWLGYCLPGDLGEEAKSTLTEFRGLQTRDARIGSGLNGAIFLAPTDGRSALIQPEVEPVARSLGRPALAVRHFIEQPPRRESHFRIEGDRLSVHWSVGDEERSTIEANLAALAREVRRRRLGTVDVRSCGEEVNPTILERSAHPMGGTIMGRTRTDSVVDSALAVHGLTNLFVVGGSVIPRSGASMLTGVICQLAFRLAAHLEAHLE